MRATPAGEVGMALPAACVALLARDARAPLSRFSHIASIAFSQCARSSFEASTTLDGRGAGDLALAHTGWQGWCGGLCTVACGEGLLLELWWAVAFAKNRTVRTTMQNISGLSQSPFGRISIVFDDFCRKLKVQARSRECH